MRVAHQEPWAELVRTEAPLDGSSYQVVAATACKSTGTVTCALWRIVDDVGKKACVNTVAFVRFVLNADGDYVLGETKVWPPACILTFLAVGRERAGR